MAWNYYGDPFEDGCEKCFEAGYAECQCCTYDPADPLDNPAVLGNIEQDEPLPAELFVKEEEEEKEAFKAEMELMALYEKAQDSFLRKGRTHV